jgi:hypothetical protein
MSLSTKAIVGIVGGGVTLPTTLVIVVRFYFNTIQPQLQSTGKNYMPSTSIQTSIKLTTFSCQRFGRTATIWTPLKRKRNIRDRVIIPDATPIKRWLVGGRYACGELLKGGFPRSGRFDG